MATKKKIPKQTFLTKVRQTFTEKRGLIIGIVCLILLALILWFVFRKIKMSQAENKAERELLIQQRLEAEKRIEDRYKEELRKSDSALQSIMGLKRDVEYRIKWRTEYVKMFIDTSSIATKHAYIDSLLGPR